MFHNIAGMTDSVAWTRSEKKRRLDQVLTGYFDTVWLLLYSPIHIAYLSTSGVMVLPATSHEQISGGYILTWQFEGKVHLVD